VKVILVVCRIWGGVSCTRSVTSGGQAKASEKEIGGCVIQNMTGRAPERSQTRNIIKRPERGSAGDAADGWKGKTQTAAGMGGVGPARFIRGGGKKGDSGLKTG